MSKTTRLLAVSAIALTAGFFGVSQLQAGQLQANDIVIAQAGGGGSGGSGGGSGGSGGSGAGSSGAGGSGGSVGREYNENSQSTNPTGRQTPPSAATSPSSPNPSQNMNQSGVPARCAAMTDATQRQACINGR